MYNSGAFTFLYHYKKGVLREYDAITTEYKDIEKSLDVLKMKLHKNSIYEIAKTLNAKNNLSVKHQKYRRIIECMDTNIHSLDALLLRIEDPY